MSDDTNRKEELRNFLDAMVDDNQEQAGVHFHNYLEDRMKGIVNPAVSLDAEADDVDTGEGDTEVEVDDGEGKADTE